MTKRREFKRVTLYCSASAPDGYEDLGWAEVKLCLQDIQWIRRQMELVALLVAMGESPIGIKFYSGMAEFGELSDDDYGFCDQLVADCDWKRPPKELTDPDPKADCHLRFQAGRTDGDQIIISADDCYFACWPHHGDAPGLIDTHRLSKAELEGYARDLLAAETVVAVTDGNDRRVRSRRRVIEVDAPTKDG